MLSASAEHTTFRRPSGLSARCRPESLRKVVCSAEALSILKLSFCHPSAQISSVVHHLDLSRSLRSRHPGSATFGSLSAVGSRSTHGAPRPTSFGSLSNYDALDNLALAAKVRLKARWSCTIASVLSFHGPEALKTCLVKTRSIRNLAADVQGKDL